MAIKQFLKGSVISIIDTPGGLNVINAITHPTLLQCKQAYTPFYNLATPIFR